ARPGQGGRWRATGAPPAWPSQGRRGRGRIDRSERRRSERRSSGAGRWNGVDMEREGPAWSGPPRFGLDEPARDRGGSPSAGGLSSVTPGDEGGRLCSWGVRKGSASRNGRPPAEVERGATELRR